MQCEAAMVFYAVSGRDAGNIRIGRGGSAPLKIRH